MQTLRGYSRNALNDMSLLRPGRENGVFEPLTLAEENLVSQYSLGLTVQLVGQRCASCLWYSHSLTMKFAGVLASFEGAQRETLSVLKNWWVVWEAAETQQWSTPDLSDWLHDVVWLSWPWNRRLMICLLEHEFNSCPEDVRQEVRNMLSCMATTKQTEDAIGILCKQEAASQSGKFELASRWRALVASSVLRNADRPEVAASSASRQQAQQSGIPSRVFDPESVKREHQLDEDVLKKLVAEDTSHRSPSAARFDQANLQWMTLQAVYPQFSELSKHWWNSLVVVGTIVQNEETKVAGMFIYASAYGCLGWRLHVERIGGKNYFTLRSSPEEEHWFHFSVADPGKWQRSSVEAISPRNLAAGHQAAEDADKVRAMVIRLRSKHKPVSLLVLSSQYGFRNCTVSVLKRLWDSDALAANVQGKKQPQKEEELVKQLATILCPPPLDLKAVWAARGRKTHLDSLVAMGILHSCRRQLASMQMIVARCAQL